jgi:hypothetical protein
LEIEAAQFPPPESAWIGGGLRINPGGDLRRTHARPHDSHWYIHFGNSLLYVIDGYGWHTRLPLQDTLIQSDSISIRVGCLKRLSDWPHPATRTRESIGVDRFSSAANYFS